MSPDSSFNRVILNKLKVSLNIKKVLIILHSFLVVKIFGLPLFNFCHQFSNFIWKFRMNINIRFWVIWRCLHSFTYFNSFILVEVPEPHWNLQRHFLFCLCIHYIKANKVCQHFLGVETILFVRYHLKVRFLAFVCGPICRFNKKFNNSRLQQFVAKQLRDQGNFVTYNFLLL